MKKRGGKSHHDLEGKGEMAARRGTPKYQPRALRGVPVAASSCCPTVRCFLISRDLDSCNAGSKCILFNGKPMSCSRTQILVLIALSREGFGSIPSALHLGRPKLQTQEPDYSRPPALTSSEKRTPRPQK